MTLRHSVVGAFVLLTLSCTQGNRAPVASAESRGGVARPAAAATGGDPATTMRSHTIVRPDQVKWADGPPSLPPGAKFAVLEGDPAKAGFFVMRAMLPANYRIPPHWHPTVERITVLSGTMYLGMGERFDESAGQALPAGTYATMPPGMRHFAWTQEPTVIQLGTNGPWAINYLNPADDPRQQKR
jgi:quercetin dioxygenase-like cupin family protein